MRAQLAGSFQSRAAMSADPPAPGEIHQAPTDRGTPVRVWVPNAGLADDLCYICHGLSFYTFRDFRYSVVSDDASRVLLDEFTQIRQPGGNGQFSSELPGAQAADLASCLDQALAGTVVAWVSNRVVLHTARILTLQPNGERTSGNTVMQTKNGVTPLRESFLSEVCGVYAAQAPTFSMWSRNDLLVVRDPLVAAAAPARAGAPGKPSCLIM